MAGCSTDGHCPHHLRALAPAFKLQASAQALASPPVRSQGHPQHLLWLTPHMQSVQLLLPQQRLWGQVLSPRQPCMASLGVPSISHLHALLRPPYSLTVPALVPCCCQVSSCHTASSRHCPAYKHIHHPPYASSVFTLRTGNPAIPGPFGSVSLHVLCPQPYPKCPSPFFPSKLPFVPPSSSHGTSLRSLHSTPSAPCWFSQHLVDHFPYCRAIICICLSSPPDCESLESEDRALFIFRP